MNVVRARSLWLVLVLLAALLALATIPTGAHADGDPGSDVLYSQNLFANADAGLTISQQVQLGKLLNETMAAGAPVRVAIIAKADDLGTVTALWGDPQRYAQYLGTELSLVYTGRLLVVMPNGYGVLHFAKSRDSVPGQLAKALHGLPAPGSSPADLVSGTTLAVYAIEAAAGVSETQLANARGASSASETPAAASTRNRPKAGVHHTTPGAVFLIVVVLLLIAYVAWRRGWRPRLAEGWWRRAWSGLKRTRVKPVALLPTVLLLIVAAALVINHANGTSSQPASDLSNNPYLDPGTQLRAKAAPSFTLTDERGRHVSLSQYRGKVVILSFVDAECQTICPLTTQAMLYAKRSLGAAGKDVQLLGIDVNWKSTQIDDVLNYTELHGLKGQWHFLTGSLKQLESVWSAYGVDEKKYVADEQDNNIDHVAATVIIDPRGRERTIYNTYPSYASVKQFGQLMARDASALLPKHPRVRTGYSYAEVPKITPGQQASIPKLGGGSVALGPGKPHLYLFFATWDTQTTPIAGKLSQLNAYERYARTHGLPGITAVDEGSVEPSTSALPDFMKTLPAALRYPVAIDQTGELADGYEVQGDPWFVLTSAGGTIAWDQEVYLDGWPTLTELEGEVKDALSKTPAAPRSLSAQLRYLEGSPAPLASLHMQAAKLLPGGGAALAKRIAALHGYPIVINIWGSWCVPCQKEFKFFQQGSALYGKKVAFLGADYNDEDGNARVFLREHPVTYPSYTESVGSIDSLLQGGVEGTPTTIFISPAGKLLYVKIGPYDSQGSLNADIQDYGLGNAG